MNAGNAEELLFTEDMIPGWRLLVDSGAQRSVLPASATDTLVDNHGPLLNAANGTPICTFCTRFVVVCFSGRQFG